MDAAKGFTMMSFLHTSRYVSAAGLTCVLVAAPAFAQPPEPVDLGSAETFAVLGSTSVTNSGATTLNGDFGIFPGTTLPAGVTLGTGASSHAGDAVAALAAYDVDQAFSDLDGRTCTGTITTAGGVYAGGTLATPGVYCFDQPNVQITGPLTLTGPGRYILKVAGTLATTANVLYSPAVTAPACNGSNVYWHVAGATATLGPATSFVGTLVAHEDATLGAGATVDGRVLSHEGDVALDGNTITACTDGKVFPAYPSIKVTGGGGINVPSPNDPDPEATGNGFANYGFNANPGAPGATATGSFNYLNHALGNPPYHLVGTVDDVDVIAANPDGSAQTVRFSGVCARIANCSFVATVQDNGEPGRDDQFGVAIVVSGEVVEQRSMRQVRNGNIQFHTATLTTDVNSTSLRGGQTLRLSARLRRDRTVSTRADAYVVLRTPGGQLLSWTGSSLVPGLAPVARNFIPMDFEALLLQIQVPLGTPAGTYTWMSALTDAGTMNLRSGVVERSFTIQP
jgi:hypothetical protein